MWTAVFCFLFVCLFVSWTRTNDESVVTVTLILERYFVLLFSPHFQRHSPLCLHFSDDDNNERTDLDRDFHREVLRHRAATEAWLDPQEDRHHHFCHLGHRLQVSSNQFGSLHRVYSLVPQCALTLYYRFAPRETTHSISKNKKLCMCVCSYEYETN